MKYISLKIDLFFLLSCLNVFHVRSFCETTCTNCLVFNENTTESIFTTDRAKNLTVVVELKGNPTTGYTWLLSNRSVSSSQGLKLINNPTDQYYSDPNPSNFTGIGGTFCFKFQFQNSNSSTLNFEYVRPWEKQPIDTKTFSVGVPSNANLDSTVTIKIGRSNYSFSQYFGGLLFTLIFMVLIF